jgi:hypothetical protein
MDSKDESVVEALLAVTEELTPLTPPEPGELLITKWKYRNPTEALLQERNGIWYVRDLTRPESEWEAQHYYVPWQYIWKKYAPIHRINPRDAPNEGLEDLLEVISWVPAGDI